MFQYLELDGIVLSYKSKHLNVVKFSPQELQFNKAICLDVPFIIKLVIYLLFRGTNDLAKKNNLLQFNLHAERNAVYTDIFLSLLAYIFDYSHWSLHFLIFANKINGYA